MKLETLSICLILFLIFGFYFDHRTSPQVNEYIKNKVQYYELKDKCDSGYIAEICNKLN